MTGGNFVCGRESKGQIATSIHYSAARSSVPLISKIVGDSSISSLIIKGNVIVSVELLIRILGWSSGEEDE